MPSEFMVMDRRPAGGQHGLGRRLRETLIDLVLAHIHHEAVWIESGIEAVVALLVRRKASKVLRCDPGVNARGPVGPGGMAVGAEQDDGLLREGACTQRRVD